MELKAFLPDAWEQFKLLFAKYVRKTFVGTRAEWNQLPVSERIKYDLADLEDDYDQESPTSLVLQTTAEARRGQSGTPGATELAYTYTAEQRGLFTCSWYIANSSESTLIYSSFIAKINGIKLYGILFTGLSTYFLFFLMYYLISSSVRRKIWGAIFSRSFLRVLL